MQAINKGAQLRELAGYLLAAKSSQMLPTFLQKN